jgi:hypothetical protein
MKRQITAPSQNTKLILRGFLISLGFLMACASLWWGIYLGDKHRATILKVERRLFGEKKSSLPIELDAKGSIITSSSGALEDSDKKPAVVDKARRAGKQTAKKTNTKSSPNRPDQPTSSSQGEAEAHKPQIAAATNRSESIQKIDPASAPPADANRDDTNLANLRAVPVTKQIKILVADGYAASQSDWIAQTVRAVSTASRIFNTEFGIELRVVGVVRWLDALPDMTNRELLTNLRKHPREGADMLLGFVDKELGGDSYSLGAPDPNSPYNGAYGLVGRAIASEPSFLRGVLCSVGHLLGAEQVTDTQSEAYRLGSWMSSARPPSDRPPWIDMPNRKRILLRKSLPSWNPTHTVP